MIEVKNLTKTYKTGNKALKGINIQIQDGEFVFRKMGNGQIRNQSWCKDCR